MSANGRNSAPIYFCSAASPAEEAERGPCATASGPAASLISAASPSTRKRRDENILLQDARMHGDERGRRRRRRCRQGAELGQHQPRQPIGGEHEEAAGKRRASIRPTSTRSLADRARRRRQIGELPHLDHEERVVVAISCPSARHRAWPIRRQACRRESRWFERAPPRSSRRGKARRAWPRKCVPHRPIPLKPASPPPDGGSDIVSSTIAASMEAAPFPTTRLGQADREATARSLLSPSALPIIDANETQLEILRPPPRQARRSPDRAR